MKHENRGLVWRVETLMNSYEIAARYYDAAYEAKKLADLPFYLEVAKGAGGPVIELGCGTGRITLPIAREGIDITAVDLSEPMLRVLSHKLARETDDVRARVTVLHDDMRTMRLDRKFPLVIIPFRAFQHMHTIDDQLGALSTARELLAPDGRLVFDVFNPRLDRVSTGVGQEIEDLAWESAEEDRARTVRRFFIKDKFDALSMSFSGRFLFRVFEDGTLVREECEPLRMTCFPHPHLRLLFRLAGFEVVTEYGTFDKQPLVSGSPEMIFVLRRKAWL